MSPRQKTVCNSVKEKRIQSSRAVSHEGFTVPIINKYFGFHFKTYENALLPKKEKKIRLAQIFP